MYPYPRRLETVERLYEKIIGGEEWPARCPTLTPGYGYEVEFTCTYRRLDGDLYAPRARRHAPPMNTANIPAPAFDGLEPATHPIAPFAAPPDQSPSY
jgi:hypothetical protein